MVGIGRWRDGGVAECQIEHLVMGIGLDERWQCRAGHVPSQVEAGHGRLVVASVGCLSEIVRVLKQTVDMVYLSGVVGGKSHESAFFPVDELLQHQFLTPVAIDVAEEHRSHRILCHQLPSCIFGYLVQSFPGAALVVFGDDDGAVVAGAGCHDRFPSQVSVPPDALVGEGFVVADYIALGVVDVGHGRPHLISLVSGIHVHAFASAHVTHGGKVPFPDGLTVCSVIEDGAEHVGGVLLDGENLLSRTVGVDVGETETVTMGDACVPQHPAVMVEGKASVEHLVLAVTVYIADADAMKL